MDGDTPYVGSIAYQIAVRLTHPTELTPALHDAGRDVVHTLSGVVITLTAGSSSASSALTCLTCLRVDDGTTIVILRCVSPR